MQKFIDPHLAIVLLICKIVQENRLRTRQISCGGDIGIVGGEEKDIRGHITLFS